MGKVEDKIKELGLELGTPASQRGKLAPAVRTGNLVFTSGHTGDAKGKVGRDLTIEEGYRAAQQSILRCLGAVKWLVGDLDKVTRVVKVLGLVNSAEGFGDQPAVMHGATDTLLQVFGEEVGWHARSALGIYDLPGNAAVEIEMIVEVKD